MFVWRASRGLYFNSFIARDVRARPGFDGFHIPSFFLLLFSMGERHLRGMGRRVEREVLEIVAEYCNAACARFLWFETRRVICLLDLYAAGLVIYLKIILIFSSLFLLAFLFPSPPKINHS